MFRFLEQPILDPPILWIAEMGVDRARVGVHEQEGWCLTIGSKLHYFKSENSCLFLLPLLELPRAEVRCSIEKLGLEWGRLACRLLPGKQLILCALRLSRNDYWAEKAFDWIVEDHSLAVSLTSELIELLKDRAFDQSLRHKVQRLLRLMKIDP